MRAESVINADGTLFSGQSLAREFQPQGIHVAHTILDGERIFDDGAEYFD